MADFETIERLLNQHFRVFWLYVKHDEYVPASSPRLLPKPAILDLANQVLTEEGAFLGIIDDQDQTIQFKVGPRGRIVVDIPWVEEHGSLQRRVSKDEVDRILLRAENPLAPDLISHLEFSSWSD